MTEPTPDQLAEWRRLADEATEGPWEAYSLPAVPPGQWQMVGVGQVDNEMGHRIEAMFDDDAEFVAAARTAVPVLLDEVERLREGVQEVVADLIAADDLRRPIDIYKLAERLAGLLEDR